MADIEVGLLIGLNCPNALRPGEIVYGEDSDPYAVRSVLGWYINGPLRSQQQSSRITCNRIDLSPDEDSFRTFLCEAKYTINNRPLAVETISDPHSAPPLSPSMLLTGKAKLVLPPPGEFKKEDL